MGSNFNYNYSNIPMKMKMMKRKEFDVDDVSDELHDFSLTSPARKIRRLVCIVCSYKFLQLSFSFLYLFLEISNLLNWVLFTFLELLIYRMHNCHPLWKRKRSKKFYLYL